MADVSGAVDRKLRLFMLVAGLIGAAGQDIFIKRPYRVASDPRYWG